MNKIEQIELSIKLAEEGKSKCPPEVLSIEGMSSHKTRHFLNNLSKTNYLEIGIWKGSTFVAANYGNDNYAVGIDNFSEFANPMNDLHRNLQLLKNKYQFIQSDCFEVDISKFPLFDVYFYDGCHDEEAQYKGMQYYNPVLANEFILIVDDWNWDYVRNGTRRAISDLKWNIVKEWELYARWNQDTENWWNGLFVGLVTK